MGQTANDVQKNSTSREYARKPEQFLILSDNTDRSKISTCPIHVSKISPAVFSGGHFPQILPGNQPLS